jgi:hypothetical protein
MWLLAAPSAAAIARIAMDVWRMLLVGSRGGRLEE